MFSFLFVLDIAQNKPTFFNTNLEQEWETSVCVIVHLQSVVEEEGVPLDKTALGLARFSHSHL